MRSTTDLLMDGNVQQTPLSLPLIIMSPLSKSSFVE